MTSETLPERAEQAEQPSLYRRHRPRTFAEVVGQEAVVRTLRNAVERGKVHHAYLFVGSRGTGKTSMAKILAACLNCERAPTVEPCGECSACLAIARANSLDVIEMDAASNNSVDDIRELRDSVAYAPVSGGQKVYILDEAHMLSTAAWNAFLKTLEEPPPRTVFVLATTEAAKVPATVVDRCHRFDFQRPTIEQLAAVVRRAAASESIEIPPEAIAAIARAATGSFRDALGTLEQLLTYSGPSIALEDVLAVLGVTDAAVLEELLDAIEEGDARAVLLAIAATAQSGRDAGSLAGDLEVRARELLVAQILGAIPAELSLTPEADARLLEQSQRVSHTTVVRLLELLGASLEAVRGGADPRTQLELALVKAARPELDGSVKALAARIERLESRPPGEEGEEEAARRAAGGGRVVENREAPEPPPVVEPAPPEPATPEPATDTTPAPEPASDAPASLESLCELWPAVVEAVRAPNAMLAAAIAAACPVELSGEELLVAFDAEASFMMKKADHPNNRTLVAAALRELTGQRLRPSYELRENLAANGASSVGGELTEEEWVARFIHELDAEELTSEPAAPHEKGA
ncbi:MAG: DNA polymerase III subunit gamma/tau [Solirubrobacterales bacterium]